MTTGSAMCRSHSLRKQPCRSSSHLSGHRPERKRAIARPALADMLQVQQSDGNPHLLQNRVLAVVIVDHGSKKAEANEMLEQFGALFKRACKHDVVEVAHMELATPSISDAIHKCVQRGATHVVIAPYFLSRGRHVQSDIPRLAEEAAAELPAVRIQVAEPIGSQSARCSGACIVDR